MEAPARTVRRKLGSIRRRAVFVYVARAVVAACGAALLSFALAAVAVGPVASIPAAVAAWVLIVGATLGAGAATLAPARGLRGSGAARLLAGIDEQLAHATRSAIELDADDAQRARAPDLVRAHAARVREHLEIVRPSRVIPWRAWAHPALALGAAAIVSALLAFALTDRAVSGVFALAHPGQRDEGGARLAAVVGEVKVRLVFPGYLERPAVELSDPSLLEVPRGTSVELRVAPRIEARAGELRLGEARHRLSAASDGWLEGRFVVRDDAALRIALVGAEGRLLLDPTRREVRALADAAPVVTLVAPTEDRTVEPREEIELVWEATDDVGLLGADLVVRTMDGREVRRSLGRWDAVPEPDARGRTSVVAGAFGAGPGDSITVLVVARDGDEVAGPNEGRSAARVITVASDASRREAQIAELDQVLDAALGALADRLEHAVADGDEGRARHALVSASGAALEGALSAAASAGRARPGAADASLLEEMRRRLARLAGRERRLYGGTLAQSPRRRSVDAELVEELERDTLLLSDLVSRARIDDAAAIARELDALRRHMASLLAELRQADSEEARRALLEAIARAQARMGELAQRLAQMQEQVPGDFVNAEALPQQEARDALESLRDAVERGDLDAAERSLADLQRQIDQLAAALAGGAEAFSEERFGPRERALAEAMDALAGLETEERQLARRTSDLRREAAERAIASTGSRNDEAARRLAPEAARILEELEAVARSRELPADSEMLERARQRVRDVQDSLSTGDLGEARRMAQQAAAEADELARDLDLSALMFPGPEGRTADAARAARRAAEGLDELGRGIDRAIPSVGDFVGERGEAQLRDDAPRQGRAAGATGSLAERFAQGPDGSPLSPDTARGLEEAAATMRRAERALRGADPIEASRAQDEAARKLTELREALEREQRGGGGGGGGGEGGQAGPDFREPVRIPGAEDFRGPVERRRRILDAMRERAPAGFEDAVRRYYEELLR